MSNKTTTNPTTTIKYIKVAKYETLMFVPIHIEDKDKDYINVKQHNKSKFIFLASKKIRGPKLVEGHIYKVDISQHLWKGLTITRYHLTSVLSKTKPITHYFPRVK